MAHLRTIITDATGNMEVLKMVIIHKANGRICRSMVVTAKVLLRRQNHGKTLNNLRMSMEATTKEFKALRTTLKAVTGRAPNQLRSKTIKETQYRTMLLCIFRTRTLVTPKDSTTPQHLPKTQTF